MTMSYNDEEKQFLIWLHAVSTRFLRLTDLERISTLDNLISLCGSKELIHLCDLLPNLLYRDFLRLLPREISIKILMMLDEKSVLSCCLVSKSWNSLIHSVKDIWVHLAERAGARVSMEPLRSVNSYKLIFLKTTHLVEEMTKKSAFDQMILEGHRGRVMSITCSRDMIATGSDDHTVRLWDIHTGECVKVINTHTVSALHLDNVNVYTASYDNTAACWDIDTGQLNCRYVGHVSAVFSLDARRSLDLLVTGSADKTVKLWQLSTGALLNTMLDWHDDWITRIKIISYTSSDKTHGTESDLLEHGTLQFLSVDRQYCCYWTLTHNQHVNVSITRSADWCMHVPCNTWENHHSVCMWNKRDSIQCLYTYATETLDNRCVPKQISAIKMPKDLPPKQTILGIGQKFAAFMVDEGGSRVVVVDIQENRIMCSIPVPPYRPTQNGASVTMGNFDWLDGFTDNSRMGLFLALCLKDNNILVLKWKDNS